MTPLLRPAPVLAQGAAGGTPIAAIQGAGAASPLSDQDVSTWGVVTALTEDGFYLQDPVGDGDPATSDGIYAFTYDAPTVTVGECVQVEAEVAEYYAKTELNWLTTITPSTACGTGAITPVMLPRLRPGDDPAATLEALEGMMVQLDATTAVVHGPTKQFSSGETEVAFLPAHWQRYLGQVHLYQTQAEVSGLLYLSNRAGMTLPDVRWGDLLHIGEAGLVGVLDYNFGKYQLLPLPSQTLTVTTNSVAEAALPPLRADEYGVCSYNLHGLGKGTAQFADSVAYEVALQQRAAFIASELAGCTVIALQETGSPDDAEQLATALNSNNGFAYQALAIEGPASYDTEFPLTNSLLVDSTRVQVMSVASVVGCAPQDYGIVSAGVCGQGEYPIFDRPPLLAQLTITGAPDAPWPAATTLWVINNHWKSKSGDEVTNAQLRAAQANAVAAQVQTILSSDPAAQIVVLGDLNDFYQGEAVTTLQSATGLFHPYEWLPPLDRYTYIFNGAAQVLDHVLVTPNLAPQLALVDIRHVQADLPAGESARAHSDHDPVVLRVRPSGAANVGGTLVWGEITIRATDGSGAELAQGITDAGGEYRLWGMAAGQVTLDFVAPEWVVLDALTQTLETSAGMTMPAGPHARHATAITGAWVALNTPWLATALIE